MTYMFTYVKLALSLNAQGIPFEVTDVRARAIGKVTTIETAYKSCHQGSVAHV